MLKKILLGFLAIIVIGALSLYLYFTAGKETYPEILSTQSIAVNFSGTDQRGTTIELSDALKNGPVVLIFYRGFWCPACQQHLSELENSLDRFSEKGATVLAITPELTENSLQNLPNNGSVISVIEDIDGKIINAYKVDYKIGVGTERLLGVMGVNLEESNGNNLKTLPIPALYVIGKDGRIKFAYEKAGGLVPSYLPVEDILAKISD